MGFPVDPRQQAYPSWPMPPGNPAARPTNGAAIAALIFAILFAPVGIILGHVARHQIKRTGEGGAGLAKAALIIGYIFVVTPLVAALILSVFLVSNGNSRESNMAPVIVTQSEMAPPATDTLPYTP